MGTIRATIGGDYDSNNSQQVDDASKYSSTTFDYEIFTSVANSQHLFGIAIPTGAEALTVGQTNISPGAYIHSNTNGIDADFSSNTAAVNFFGGDVGDILIGGSGNDTLDGGGGNDVLSGGTGTNTIDGGTGSNTVDYENYVSNFLNIAGVKVDLGAGTEGDADFQATFADTLANIQNVRGSSFNDVLTGDATSRNIMEGGAGADMITAGDANDVASYYHSAAGVTVDLTLDASGTAQTSAGDASGDVLVGIENVIGSAFDDTLTGDGNANILIGLGGSDTLSGMGGDDILRIQGTPTLVDGGTGMNTLSVSGTATLTDTNFANIARVVVYGGANLDMSGVDAAVTGGIPTLIRSQSAAGTAATISGTQGNDMIFAGKDSDSLTGGLGDDRLYGSAGNTTFSGSGSGNGDGDGNDVMFAGSGTDSFNELKAGFGRDLIYKADFSTDSVDVAGLGNDFRLAALNGGKDTLIYNGAVGRGAGTDLLVLKGISLADAQTAAKDGHIFSSQVL